MLGLRCRSSKQTALIGLHLALLLRHDVELILQQILASILTMPVICTEVGAEAVDIIRAGICQESCHPVAMKHAAWRMEHF